ncbi:translin-like protein [Phlyctochytrium arcticum]|nr:translin-like protein [Phlyctochytrium arcticum]
MVNFEYFQDLVASVDDETAHRENIRVRVRELEKQCRVVAAILNQIHFSTTEETIQKASEAATAQFKEVREAIRSLAELVPKDQYYRYNTMWLHGIQQAIFLASYIHYLWTETLITIPEIEELLGVKVDLKGQDPGFHLGVEDFLHGVVSLPAELGRLAVNCVTHGDYNRPSRISKFVGELYSGFQLLNLKNDSLRKRFDSLKYDIKKIEEVVYDIRLRGLAKLENPEPSNPEIKQS